MIAAAMIHFHDAFLLPYAAIDMPLFSIFIYADAAISLLRHYAIAFAAFFAFDCFRLFAFLLLLIFFDIFILLLTGLFPLHYFAFR